MADSHVIQLAAEISGSHFTAIETAVGVARQASVDVSRCRIDIVRDAGAVSVVFTPPASATAPEAARVFAVEWGRGDSAPSYSGFANHGTKTGEVLAALQGEHYLPMEAAAKLFRRRMPSFSPYRITLMREGRSWVATFTRAPSPLEPHGGIGGPGFEVEMNVSDLRTVRANFIR